MRICLILDNPLRDLDGLVLIAWHLAQEGAEIYIVPMYSQGFDVISLQPDIVVANYVRNNNKDLLALYHDLGMRVIVLDTEGSGGPSSDEYARLVASANCADYVDAYLLWGPRQKESFVRYEVLPESRLHVVGCPRYDYCVVPWRDLLPIPDVPSGYVLINTNFPIVNPRFNRDTGEEIRTWVRTGVDNSFSNTYAEDARRALDELKISVLRLATRYADTNFVIRPHPFERLGTYNEFQGLPNVQVRQEGSSLQWIQHAKMLLHLNCSTAVEAAMLGREVVSLEWCNTPTLLVPSASRVSRHAHSYEELEALVGACIKGTIHGVDTVQREALQMIIEENYLSLDGNASRRAAELILEHKSTGAKSIRVWQHLQGLRLPIAARSKWAHVARLVLGYRAGAGIKRMLVGNQLAANTQAKLPSLSAVNDLLRRLATLRPDAKRLMARFTDHRDCISMRMCSRMALRIAAD